jgi:hypothetical protein
VKKSSGLYGVRQRQSGGWAADITNIGERLWLGMFDSPEEAARIYEWLGMFDSPEEATRIYEWLGMFDSPEEAARTCDVIAWRLGRPRRELNFTDVESVQEAEFLAPLFWVMSRTEELQTHRE